MIGVIAALAIVAGDVTASRTLGRGMIIEASDLEGDAATREELIGRQLRRSVREGGRLWLSDTSAPLAVMRQSTVSIVFRRGSLRLITEGRAMGQGGVGDSISVTLPGRRSSVMATIIGPGRVEVSP
ncbi:flagellar basal body P-ring formation protein FlgA [Parvularcula sp. ZS-1/3]|uniref:Flagella basal body P-ring formation protein FlgA n=1 Tax=Parvularcula mediterranea TaxID=2732508 RepID=A0A7Y3W4L8_9PROT|nr:flagellar basal body P-ring formation chaperone FlgA [Parvularcula mediterranea]NNU15381.1 flagellar basal body P-ring formation protein FlgA [Parvularcula mediterranea]